MAEKVALDKTKLSRELLPIFNQNDLIMADLYKVIEDLPAGKDGLSVTQTHALKVYITERRKQVLYEYNLLQAVWDRIHEPIDNFGI